MGENKSTEQSLYVVNMGNSRPLCGEDEKLFCFYCVNHAIAVMGTTVGMVKMHLKIIFVCTW